MTGISNVNSFNANIQTANNIEKNSQTNSTPKEYSYSLLDKLKGIGRYLTCGFSSSKRRQIIKPPAKV